MSANIQSEKTSSIWDSVWLYFAFAFLISWLLQLPTVLSHQGYAEVPDVLLFIRQLAPFGPFAAAALMLIKKGGLPEFKALWKRGWQFQFEKRWLAAVLIIPAVMMGLTIAVVYLTGNRILWEHQPLPPAMSVPIFIAIYLTQALPEEYGWRGFALDRLQSRWGALVASLILGLIWGLWHLPLHFIEGTTQAVIPIHEFILKQMLGAVFYTWIYNNTKGNVFIVILLHAYLNVLGGLVPYWITTEGRWINFLLELIMTISIVMIFGPKRLVRSRENTISGNLM